MFGLPIDECPLSVFLKARDSRICVRSPEWIILSDSRGLLIFQDESVGLNQNLFNSVASILFTPFEFISVWSAVPDRISLPTPLLRAFKEVHSMVICIVPTPEF